MQRMKPTVEENAGETAIEPTNGAGDEARVPPWVVDRSPPPTLEESISYCTRLTRHEARNFYFAFLLLPPDRRRAISAVYTFSRRVDDAVDDLFEGPSADRPREELIREGHRALEYMESLLEPDAPRTDPLTLALDDANRRFRIPLEHYRELIAGMRMDLEGHRYETFDDTHRYCYRAASTVGLISIEIFGYRGKAELDAGGEGDRSAVVKPAIDLGIAMQLTNIIRDVAEDLERDRVYLPRQEMAEYGVTEDDLRAGRMTPGIRDLIRRQVERARDYFERSEALFPLVDRQSRFCPLLLRRLYSELLDQLEARDFDIFGPRLKLTKGRKLWLMASQWARGSLLPGR